MDRDLNEWLSEIKGQVRHKKEPIIKPCGGRKKGIRHLESAERRMPRGSNRI